MLIINSTIAPRSIVQTSSGALLLEVLGKVVCALTTTDLVNSNLACLNSRLNEADTSSQRSLLPQEQRFAELDGQNSDIKLNDALESTFQEC